jgi:membrane protease YdiL (CAAX protease family)
MLGTETKKLFVSMFAILLLHSSVFGVLRHLFFGNDFIYNGETLKSLDDVSLLNLFMGIVLAPLFETLINQRVVIRICRLYVKNNLICLVVSAILFGLMHYNNVAVAIENTYRVFTTTVIGLYLGLFYTVLKRKKLNAFYLTVLLHASWNCFVISLRYITK